MLLESLKEQGIECFTDSDGFYTYRKVEDKEVLYHQIHSSYIRLHNRNEAYARELLLNFEKFSKVAGVKALVWVSIPGVPDREVQMTSYIALGFKINKAEQDKVILVKEI